MAREENESLERQQDDRVDVYCAVSNRSGKMTGDVVFRCHLEQGWFYAGTGVFTGVGTTETEAAATWEFVWAWRLTLQHIVLPRATAELVRIARQMIQRQTDCCDYLFNPVPKVARASGEGELHVPQQAHNLLS